MALMNAYIRDKQVVPMSVVKEIIAWADRVKDKYASPLGPSTERALKNIAAGGDITVSGKWGNTNGSSMRHCTAGHHPRSARKHPAGAGARRCPD